MQRRCKAISLKIDSWLRTYYHFMSVNANFYGESEFWSHNKSFLSYMWFELHIRLNIETQEHQPKITIVSSPTSFVLVTIEDRDWPVWINILSSNILFKILKIIAYYSHLHRTESYIKTLSLIWLILYSHKRDNGWKIQEMLFFRGYSLISPQPYVPGPPNP